MPLPFGVPAVKSKYSFFSPPLAMLKVSNLLRKNSKVTASCYIILGLLLAILKASESLRGSSNSQHRAYSWIDVNSVRYMHSHQRKQYRT